MSTFAVKIVRIGEIRKHTNADSLGLVDIEGFQVVVRLDTFSSGRLAIYIPPDSVIPESEQFRFVYEKDGAGQKRELPEGIPVPEKYRRVTVRKFRGEWSEGLLLPASDFFATDPPEGTDVSQMLGITHWNPPDDSVDSSPIGTRQSRIWPKSWKGRYYFIKHWLGYLLSFGLYNPFGNVGGMNEKAPKVTPPVYDVENFKHYKEVFQPGQNVIVTEKIHGSNARFVFENDIFGCGKMYAGSRNFWKSPKSSNVWRKLLEVNPHIEKFCRANPGYVLYGEAVPTQKGFDYGYTTDKPGFFLFDIRDPKGGWVEYADVLTLLEGYDIKTVPVFWRGEFSDKVFEYVDGQTQTAGKHIREGVVIKTEPESLFLGLGRAQLKVISNRYLLKEQ